LLKQIENPIIIDTFTPIYYSFVDGFFQLLIIFQNIFRLRLRKDVKVKIENNAIVLGQRYDSGNAKEFEESLTSALEQVKDHLEKNGKLVLDAKKMEYISSAGLRVLLSLRKQVPNIEIINVSRDVLDILQLTGFDTMFKVKRALREITVDESTEIGHGLSSRVFRIDRDTIVKIYEKKVPFEKIEQEVANAKTAFLFGIQTIISYDLVTWKDRFGTVFELVDAEVLSSYLNKHPEQFDEYKEKYKKMLKQSHSTEVDDTFTDVKVLWCKWADMLSRWISDEDVARIKRMISLVPDTKTFIHSDIHANNVMVKDGELVLIDMADIGRGHNIFDIGPLCFHYHYLEIANREMADNLIVLKKDLRGKMYNMLLEEYIDEPDPEKHEKIARIYDAFGQLRCGMLAVKHSQMDEDKKGFFVNLMIEKLLPQIDEIIDLIPQYLK